MARARSADPEYFNAINVTPFIDVMLVLLVVIILSLPIANHKLAIDLPQPGRVSAPLTPHQLGISAAGALSWDGAPIRDAELPARLAAMQAEGNGELQMIPDPEARYERFDAVLATVKRAGVTRLGFANRPLE